MGARYAAVMKRTASATLDVGSINSDASTPRRAWLYDVILSSESSPADNLILLSALRATTVGTADAVTEEPLDPADAASSAAVVENHTVNGTSAGGDLLAFSLNQRATMRWVAAPGGALVVPAVANNGLAFQTLTIVGTPLVTLTTHYEE